MAEDEGDYTSWAHQWNFAIPNGSPVPLRVAYFIDEEAGNFALWWRDSSNKKRFGTYTLSDHTTVFESPGGSNYISGYPDLLETKEINMGCVHGSQGMSRSLTSYLLLAKQTAHTVEVWRGGATPLWTRDITLDLAGALPLSFEISSLGKYIMIHDGVATLMLYKGA